MLYDGKVYIGGGNEVTSTATGSYRLDVYDPAENSWSPFPINTRYKYFAMTTLNNQLITAGGIDRFDTVTKEIFLLDGDYLEKYTRMITPRYDATAAGHQGTLIITGGKGYQNRILVTTELFDSVTDQWYTTSNLPLPHSELKPVIVDNTLYLLGGFNEYGKISPAAFAAPLYTLSSHKLQWTIQQDTPWCHSAPVSMHGRHLLTVGGWKKTGNARTRDIYLFNKFRHSWKVIGQIPSSRRAPAAVSVTDNKIVVVGGIDDKGQYTNTVWIGSQ